MKKEYDFSTAKKNPYTRFLKQQITIRLDAEIVEYFKNLSNDHDIPYQILINLYLRDCAMHHKKPNVTWLSKK